MIARGDLGVEVPIEQIALVQKSLMRKAQPGRQAGDHRHADAGVDDAQPACRRAPRPPTSPTPSSTAPTASCCRRSRPAGATPSNPSPRWHGSRRRPSRSRSRFELWERMKTLPQEVHPDLYDLTSIAAEAIIEFGKSAVVVVPTGSGRTVEKHRPLSAPGVDRGRHFERTCGAAPALFLRGAPGPAVAGGSTTGTPSRASSWPHMVSRGPWPCCCRGPSEVPPRAQPRHGADRSRHADVRRNSAAVGCRALIIGRPRGASVRGRGAMRPIRPATRPRPHRGARSTSRSSRPRPVPGGRGSSRRPGT